VVPISQSELGSMLSLSRQTTNQILMDLQQRGVLRLAYGRIEVLDRPGLAAAARLSPAEARILKMWGSDEVPPQR
jgi:DNA-binding CsgD family transcriptional regulator